MEILRDATRRVSGKERDQKDRKEGRRVSPRRAEEFVSDPSWASVLARSLQET
jgi:hypothetical protein